VSTNFGSTWTAANSPIRDWSALACSADGSVIIALGDGLFVSRDSGATWTPSSLSPPYGSSLACSADGKGMVAEDSHGVHLPTNSGTVWVVTSSPKFGPVAMSADGSRLAIAASLTPRPAVNISTNFGLTGTPVYPTTETMYPWFIATSADGATLIM